MIGLPLLILHNQLVLPKFRRCEQYTIDTVVHMPQYTIATLFQAANRGERWWKSSTAKQRQSNRICDGLWLWLAAHWGVGWRIGWLFRLGQRIFWFYLWILEVSVMSLSLVYCALFFNHALKPQLSALKSQILNQGSHWSLLVSLKNYFFQP